MARPAKPVLDLSNIVVRPDGSHRIDVVRKLPSGGKFRRTTVRKDQADAIAFRDEALAEFARLARGETVIAEQGYTVESWCHHALTSILPNQANRRGKAYAPKTLDDYRSVLKGHVYPYVGSVRLTSLTTEHLDPVLRELGSEAVRQNFKKVLSLMMELAEARGKRPRGTNPARGLRIAVERNKRTAGRAIVHHEAHPEDGRRKVAVSTPVPDGLLIERVRVLTFEEEAALLDHVRNHPYHSDYLTLVMLGLRLGLRIGEALGLDWSAVDFAANTVTIDQQVQRERGRGVVTRNVKGDVNASVRAIPMPTSLAEHLRGVKLLSESPHVVCNSVGRRRDSARAQNRLQELTVGAGLGDKVDGRRFLPRPTFHDLRRTCLTRLATGHVAPDRHVIPCPPNTLVRISGHEDVNTLLSYYVGTDDGLVAAAMAELP